MYITLFIKIYINLLKDLVSCGLNLKCIDNEFIGNVVPANM